MKALLLGDVCPTAVASAALFAKQDIPALFDDTLSLFQNSDFSFVNLECAITDSEGAITKFGPNLKAPKETAAVLQTVGVDVCGLSNNHIFDFGIQGAKDTMEALDACGIAYTGFGANEADAKRNYVMEKDGQKIALIAVCEHEYSYALEDRMGSRGFDPFESVLEVQKAKAECDRVIVLYHGGKEQCRYPSPRLLKACRAMADHGADLILCQHSHCIGCYEEYNGCHILYGQGNFHFVYPETQNDGWKECLAVYYDTVSDKIEFVPVQQTDTGITLAKGEEKETILADFAKRNQELANGKWKQGWHAFCEMKRPSYEKAIHFACLEESTERQNHHFAHYLDCEAHTDVWRELFPTYNQTNEKQEPDMVTKILNDRNIPPLMGRDEMLDILQKQEYGYLPKKPEKMEVCEEKSPVPNFCAGKATLQKLVMTVTCNGRNFSFPFYAAIPTKAGKHPFFIHINFRDAVPDRYMPSEELIDHGFAVLSFCYLDVTSDNKDFTDKLAGVFYPDGNRDPEDAGKLAMWAWAAQRVMDWAETDERLDKETAIVCGHSRLGKTALLTAATDERFRFAYSNDSGCSGAAITRGKIGEHVKNITKGFPYWFCENYLQYIENEDAMPFDQHYLVASIAPRFVAIGSAKKDDWADPDSEFLTCVAASPMYESLGMTGFVHQNRLPAVGEVYHDGSIGYHLRAGTHFFSREDWLKLIDFVEKKCGKNFDL